MKRLVFLMMLVVVFAIAPTVVAQTVETHTQKGVDLTEYKTFTVTKGEFMTPADEKNTDEDALFATVKKSIIEELEMRGYKYAPDSGQMVVSYVAGGYNFTDGGSNGPLGQRPADNPVDMDQSRTWSRETREGMMMIQVDDARSKKELWKANARLVLNGADLHRALDASVYKAFKKFPKRSKKKK
jgi:Domain of unknown function (DUF4136)